MLRRPGRRRRRRPHPARRRRHGSSPNGSSRTAPTCAPPTPSTGGPVPDEHDVTLPGYPGAPVRVGNRVNSQFQLDALGEALLLLAAADRPRPTRATTADVRSTALVEAIESVTRRTRRRHLGDREPPLGPLPTHVRRRAARRRRSPSAGADGASRGRGADTPTSSSPPWTGDCLHPTGRWQRSPDDPAVDAALLLPGIRGAVAAEDPRNLATITAVLEELTDDGYVYRFRQDPERPLHEGEGAFVLCGFLLSLAQPEPRATLRSAMRWFERNRGRLGPPGLFAEEYDVVQRQLRGNLPQAFVHALLLETAHRLGQAGVSSMGFQARAR